MITKTAFKDNLADYLPLSHRPYKHTKAYDAYAEAFWEYLTSEKETKLDKFQVLNHAKDVFDNMVWTVPEPISDDPIFKGVKPELLQ